MTLDEIKAMWSKDCEIDDIELDKSSLDVPKLHSKYSDLLTDNILKLKGIFKGLQLTPYEEKKEHNDNLPSSFIQNKLECHIDSDSDIER